MLVALPLPEEVRLLREVGDPRRSGAPELSGGARGRARAPATMRTARPHMRRAARTRPHARSSAHVRRRQPAPYREWQEELRRGAGGVEKQHVVAAELPRHAPPPPDMRRAYPVEPATKSSWATAAHCAQTCELRGALLPLARPAPAPQAFGKRRRRVPLRRRRPWRESWALKELFGHRYQGDPQRRQRRRRHINLCLERSGWHGGKCPAAGAGGGAAPPACVERGGPTPCSRPESQATLRHGAAGAMAAATLAATARRGASAASALRMAVAKPTHRSGSAMPPPLTTSRSCARLRGRWPNGRSEPPVAIARAHYGVKAPPFLDYVAAMSAPPGDIRECERRLVQRLWHLPGNSLPGGRHIEREDARGSCSRCRLHQHPVA